MSQHVQEEAVQQVFHSFDLKGKHKAEEPPGVPGPQASPGEQIC